MNSFQTFFLILTFVAPPTLWALSRWFKSDRFDRIVCWILGSLLVATYLGDVTIKLRESDAIFRDALPMQLCDWVLFAVVLALWRGSKMGFELSYFWGLGGTIQALFTPAIDGGVGWLRLFGFFLSHSVIVIGVVFLMAPRGFRPRGASMVHVVAWSEIYIVTALVANALTGANYGFLSSKPAQKSMLDLFSDTHWIYVAQINLVALVFFAVLYLPWACADLWKKRRRPISPRETPANLPS